MVYITGDCHGPHTGEKLCGFSNNNDLSREDYVIVCGDFGYIWGLESDEAYLDKLAELEYTLLFVDGNHENFEKLNTYPQIEWHGGKVHKIRDNILHLMRGEIFDIDGMRCLAFGGAESHDKHTRVERISWWSEEVPTETEFKQARDNLRAYKNKVDLVLSHAVNTSHLPKRKNKMQPTVTTEMLEWIEKNVEYGAWFFGHYHQDKEVAQNKWCLYHTFIQI